MNILDPTGKPTTLTSGIGITPERQCGLYDASYLTTSEGKYTVAITAQNPSGIATFNTSFQAQSSYPFDIIRTTASKIDPVTTPNSFNVKIDLKSYVNTDFVQIREYVPSVFHVVTDAKVQTVGDKTILTWSKSLVGNAASVQYSYFVPHVYPQLYALGPAEITYNTNQTFKEARPWFVAVDPATITKTFEGSGSSTGTFTAATFTIPSTDTNTMILVGISQQSTAASQTATLSWNWDAIGWNLVSGIACKNNAATQTGSTCLYYKLGPTPATSGILTVTPDVTATSAVAGVWYLTGVAQSIPVDVDNSALVTTTTSALTFTAEITTTTANDALFSTASGDTSLTIASGITDWNFRQGVTGIFGAGNSTANQATTQTYSFSYSCGLNGNCVMWVVALKPSTAQFTSPPETG
jgi:hypothetical protein